MKKILVIAAHPDDEVLGMGGSIAKFTAEGKEVHLLIVTDGSTSQYGTRDDIAQILRQKKKETENAASLLGISSVIYGELPDMMLDMTPHTKINAVIEKAIEELKPDTVFTHFWGDVNKDHRCVYESTLVAVRPVCTQTVRELYCYSVPSSTEWTPSRADTAFLPNVFIDIEKHKEKKYSAMEAYKTELREYPHPRSVRHLRELDTAVGLQVGCGASESFVLQRKIEN